jgi:hypothetical protein
MKSELTKRIEAVRSQRPRNKEKALDKLATDLGLMTDNVIYVDFKTKRVIR